MKTVKVSIQDENTLILQEDAKKGDLIDLKSIHETDIDKSTIASVVKSIKIDEFNAQLQKEAANIERQKSLEAKLKEQELIDRSKVALSKKDQASCPRRLNRSTMGHYLIQWVFYLEATKALVTMVLKFSDIFSVQKQRQRKISWLKN